jgi:hypothetical protein
MVFGRLVLAAAGYGIGRFRSFGGSGCLVAAVAALAATPAPAVAAAALAVLVLVFVLFGLRSFGSKQRLPVGDRYLVVVGMDFAEGKEAVTVPAIFDEGSLERRFYAGDPREIDVSFELLLVL